MRNGFLRRAWGVLFFAAATIGAAHAAGYDDFANGVSALNDGKDDLAISLFTSALAAGDLSPGVAPVAYFDRARALWRTKGCATALPDLTAAVKLKPDYFDAYEASAAASLCIGDYGAAIASETQVIALRPTAAAYWTRAQMRWHEGDFGDAAADFEQCLDRPFGIARAYIVLRASISRIRAGSFDVTGPIDGKNLADAEEQTPDWPRPILRFFEGKISLDELKQAADDGDDKSVAGKRCEMNFFAGEWALGKMDRGTAKALLSSASAQCPVNLLFTLPHASKPKN